ncbi:MAG: ABC transporter permease [Pseudomonadales bacterium]|nr:ABC transporter permease [Pseudomonadales bacterium]
MNLVGLAWRNIWRRKRRTAITAVSIGFGVFLAVTFSGVGDYSYTNMINASADMGLGHITIEALDYNQSPAPDKNIDQVATIQQSLQRIPGVENSYARILGQGMFASAHKSVGGAFLAIDPNSETSKHNLFLCSLEEGALFDANSRGVIVGRGMAKKLKLRLGKKLVYTTTDKNGEIVSEIARVSGIFSTGVKAVDGAFVLLPINSVRRTVGYSKNEASLVAVMIKDQRYTTQVLASVRQQLAQIDPSSKQIEILSWRETQSEVAGLISLDRSSNYISQVLIGLLIAAGILNTLLMSVLERTREFGVMMALGMAPHTLFFLVIIESVCLAFLGLGFGVLLTTPWYFYLNRVGIDMSGAMGGDYTAGGVLIDPVLKLYLYPETIAAILFAVFLLTLLSGLYPAWKAGRTPPVESLKAM